MISILYGNIRNDSYSQTKPCTKTSQKVDETHIRNVKQNSSHLRGFWKLVWNVLCRNLINVTS